MRINKRYLAGFGVFAVTAGLYGIVSFRAYSQVQLKRSLAPVVSSQVSLAQPVAGQVNASPDAGDSSYQSTAASPDVSARVGVFVGPPTAEQKAVQDRSQKTQAPQANASASDSNVIIVDENNQTQAKDVYGPEDQSIKTNWKIQKTVKELGKEVVVKPVADEVASDFDVIASADQAVDEESQPDSRESWLKSLGISMKQFRIIQSREERLAKEVKEAQKEGADGSRDLLVTEYQEWLREYLGPDRYARFSELAAR